MLIYFYRASIESRGKSRSTFDENTGTCLTLVADDLSLVIIKVIHRISNGRNIVSLRRTFTLYTAREPTEDVKTVADLRPRGYRSVDRRRRQSTPSSLLADAAAAAAAMDTVYRADAIGRSLSPIGDHADSLRRRRFEIEMPRWMRVRLKILDKLGGELTFGV